MSPLANDPRAFREELITGLLAAHPTRLEAVPGSSGVARLGGARQGKVSVVIGGGSGHYPAFAGLVGAGLADAAVIGDIFTSPSADQVERVARRVDGGAGTLFSFGNYAGDTLNFGLAERRLKSSGIDCRSVLVTDDVAAAPRAQRELRRGIAGTLLVFKTAGAAAARGERLEEVERLARRANERTVTLGVAFSGCTLPGRHEPLFRVAPGTIELGLGIHGEMGVRTIAALSAHELALLLVNRLLEERPGDASRVAVVLNGLGATKYEELFVLFGSLHALLRDAGLEVVLPEVGEFVTSLDMAGCSLTLCFLDDELEQLWRDPADAPAFRRGAAPEIGKFVPVGLDKSDDLHEPIPTKDVAPEGPPALLVREALRAVLVALEAHEDELGRLDAVAGDGDHGTGMTRGLRAAIAATDLAHDSTGGLLRRAGRAFADAAGGTSGVLWGLLLETLGEHLGDEEPIEGARVTAGLEEATLAIQELGRAKPGDKTILDALVPFVESLRESPAQVPFPAAWNTAFGIADEAARATAGLVPKVGRARPLAERSLGSPDPGATSFALCVGAVASVLSRHGEVADRAEQEGSK